MELNDLAKHILLRDSTPPKDFNEPMDPEKKRQLVHKGTRDVLGKEKLIPVVKYS